MTTIGSDNSGQAYPLLDSLYRPSRGFSARQLFHAAAFATNAAAWLWFWTSLAPGRGENWGSHFRYLTYWGLTLNVLLSADAIVADVAGRATRSVLVVLCVPVSTLVVILYWGLVAINPVLVRGATSLPWYIEYHIHGLTAVMVWVEALQYSGCFKKLRQEILALVGTAASYMLWVELLVAPYNTRPCNAEGTVCGYPYPFLNSFTDGHRYVFYLGGVVALVLLYGMARWLSRAVWARRGSLAGRLLG